MLTSLHVSAERSPQVRCRIFPFAPSGFTLCVLMMFGLCCSSPARRPHLGLSAGSCSYGRKFAIRFFQLHLAATPCGSLRLPSSAPIGSFHPTRFCPCWAHKEPLTRLLASRSQLCNIGLSILLSASAVIRLSRSNRQFPVLTAADSHYRMARTEI
jgi:hypothetical protein